MTKAASALWPLSISSSRKGRGNSSRLRSRWDSSLSGMFRHQSDAGGTGVFSPAAKSGALVCDVYPSSPAAQGGLVGGDVITSVNGQKITSFDGLTSIMEGTHPGTKLSVVYIDSNGARHSTTITLTGWAK